MMVLAAMLAAALTRAEIIDRMKAPAVGVADGLVEVVADCPADMREEFQRPIARFADGICRTLYGGRKAKRFDRPQVFIYIGDERTNRSDIVVSERVRPWDGSKYTLIRVPAPAFADLSALSAEVARCFLRAVDGREVDSAAAAKALRHADPALRARDEAAEYAAWLNGRPVEGDDERYLKMARAVSTVGRASTMEVLHYAAGLRLYPALYSTPFCGKYTSCTFREAVDLVARDPRVRIQAFLKRPEVVAFACGRGEALSAAAVAYERFLMELAANKAGREALLDMLDDADTKLNVAFEEAAKVEKGQLQ